MTPVVRQIAIFDILFVGVVFLCCFPVAIGSQSIPVAADSTAMHPNLLFPIGMDVDSLLALLPRLGVGVGDYSHAPGQEGEPISSDPRDLPGRLNTSRGDVVVGLNPAHFNGAQRCLISMCDGKICYVQSDHIVSPCRDDNGDWLAPSEIWPARISDFKNVLDFLSRQLGQPTDLRSELTRLDTWGCYRSTHWKTDREVIELCLLNIEEGEVTLAVVSRPLVPVEKCIR